jgi:hypothetical protein
LLFRVAVRSVEAVVVNAQLFPAYGVADVLDSLDLSFSDPDLFSHNGPLLNVHTLFTQGDADLFVFFFADRGCSGFAIDGTTANEKFLVENRNVDGLLFGDDFFANTGFRAGNLLLVDEQTFFAQLQAARFVDLGWPCSRGSVRRNVAAVGLQNRERFIRIVFTVYRDDRGAALKRGFELASSVVPEAMSDKRHMERLLFVAFAFRGDLCVGTRRGIALHHTQPNLAEPRVMQFRQGRVGARAIGESCGERLVVRDTTRG